jgi:hypothetical protein
MTRFIEWHKTIVTKVQNATGWSDYKMLWLSFCKGLFLGWLLL